MAVQFATYCKQNWNETQIRDNLRVWYPGHDLPEGGILLREVAVVVVAAAAAGGEEGAFNANDNDKEDGEGGEE